MPLKILIPAGEVRNYQGKPLVLENDNRCSRCNQSPANFFEVHRLHYRVGLIRGLPYNKKYRISKDYRLKLQICETCYQSDYLTHPELLDRNNSQLARIASFHSLAWTIGSLLAACGFLLLTPIIPQNGVLGTIKQLWQVPVVLGVLVLFLTWLSQRKYQNKVLHEIEKSNPGFQPLPRAEVHANVLNDESDTSVTALEIILKNETWAEACARNNNWKFEQNSYTKNETKEKG
jgi:hypothetical protein